MWILPSSITMLIWFRSAHSMLCILGVDLLCLNDLKSFNWEKKTKKIFITFKKKFSIKSYDKFIFKVFFAFSLVQLYQQDSNTYIHVHYFCCALVGRFDVFWLAYGWFIIIKAIGCSLGGRCKATALWVGLNCYLNYVDFSSFFYF